MKDNTLSKFGGICSILAGVAILVAAVIYLLLPPEQQDACRCPEKFLVSVAQNPLLRIAEYSPIALYSLLAIGAVLAISERVRPEVLRKKYPRFTTVFVIHIT